MAKRDILTKEQERELLMSVANGDQEAFARMIEANQGLVGVIAKKYAWTNIPHEDLMQEGNIGLINAVKKFDYKRGAMFSTYAGIAIENQITSMISRYESQAVSLDTSIGEDGDVTLADTIAVPTAGEELCQADAEFVSGLPEGQIQEIIRLYLQLDTGNTEDGKAIFTEIGKRLDIVPERVRQVITMHYLSKKGEVEVSSCAEGAADYNAIEVEDFAAFAIPSERQIETGFTVRKLRDTGDWAEIEEISGEEMTWDHFYRIQNTAEMLKSIRCVDFYVYFVSYLINRFSNLLPGYSREGIYEEIRLKKADRNSYTPGLDALTALLGTEFRRNGGCKKENEHRFQSSLFQRYVKFEWEEEDLRVFLSCEKIKEKDFFLLAVGLDMTLEDVEEFLKKVLLRSCLNPFNREEFILYIALKYVKGNKYSFIQKAVKLYEQVVPRNSLPMEQEFNTTIYKSDMERFLERIQQEMIVFDDADQVMERLEVLFAHMKYMEQESDYIRSANAEFVRLYNELNRLTKKDQKRMIVSKTEAPHAEGVVLVKYDCMQGLKLAKGHRFLKKEASDVAFYEVSEAVNIRPEPIFQIVVKVECEEETTVMEKKRKSEERGNVPKKTAFASGFPYIVEAVNKSEFKANGAVGSKTRISGNLNLSCDWRLVRSSNVVLPKGSVFEAEGVRFVTTEDVAVLPCCEVKIRGEQEANKNKITEIENGECFPQIFRLENTKISFKKATRAEESQTPGMTHKLDGALDQYLYLRAAGNNIYRFNLEREDENGVLRKKLLQILSGTDIDFANRLQAVNSAKITQNAVGRRELLTMAFLVEMARVQFAGEGKQESARERIASMIQRINFLLNKCGFYDVYPVHPYDGLMLYISVFEREPLYVFRNLWGNLQDYVEKQNGGDGR